MTFLRMMGLATGNDVAAQIIAQHRQCHFGKARKQQRPRMLE
jgi:hypothetical protein